MAREHEEWGFYALQDETGERIACHAIKGKQPSGGVEINEQQFDEINEATTARSPKAPAQQPASVAPGLRPILDQLAALAKTVVSHAELHDQHQAMQAEHEQKFSEQAKAISDVKVTTAKAIAQSLEGIGEKPA